MEAENTRGIENSRLPLHANPRTEIHSSRMAEKNCLHFKLSTILILFSVCPSLSLLIFLGKTEYLVEIIQVQSIMDVLYPVFPNEPLHSA